MRYPEDLQKEGRIGFIAPSFGMGGLEPYYSRFMSAREKFTKMGYSLVDGPNVYEDSGIGKSNTAEKCGEEINTFFTRDYSDVIISCGGGETMCEDLDYVDFIKIKKSKPKWFMGYSDNTNLTFTLPTICDIAAIYGPCAGDFGMDIWHPSIEDAFSLLKGEKKSFSNYDGYEKAGVDDNGNFTAPYYITEPYAQMIFNNGEDEAYFSGRLIGGCLDILSVLCGTPYDNVVAFNEKYKKDGFIWFLESCELNAMDVRRVLWTLKRAGWFKYMRGFLIGRPYMYDSNMFGQDIHGAFREALSEFDVPIIMDIDLGHLSPMMPIVSGAIGKVEAAENKFTLSMEFR